MRKSTLLAVVLAIMLFALGVRANGGMQLTGPISATEPEAEEGYFAVSHDMMLMAKPGTEAHKWLRSHIGQRVVLTVEPDVASQ
jgi:hypothetical protein